MTFQFKSNDAEQIAEQIASVDPEQVVPALDALKALEPATLRNNVADIIEAGLLNEAKKATKELLEPFPGKTVEDAYQIGKQLHDELKNVDLTQFGDTDLELSFKEAAREQTKEELVATQALAKAFNAVAEIKGDAAQPATKSIVKEVATLQGGADHQDSFRLITKVLSGYEKAAKKGPQL